MRFIGTELQERILEEYLKLSDTHKNATYLSANTVSLFIKLVSDYMKNETISKIKSCDHFTLLLDESTNESNHSELSLIARVVREGKIENHFLYLLQLNRCDTETIFNVIQTFLNKENIDISRVLFAGMDGCSTMSGEHNGVKRRFEDICSHNMYIHCRNHRLALCFAHLIPQYEAFSQFDALLLNLYLLLKHGCDTVNRRNIFIQRE